MKPKFTPGPWVQCGNNLVCSEDMSVDICLVCSNDLSNQEVYLANAHLIAAAPELYDALNAIAKGEGLLPGQTIEQILAKARGEK